MTREYNLENISGQNIIWYEENGVRVSFTENEQNSDYQAYLNKDNPDYGKPNLI
jgi:hypothetical protein